MKLVKESLLPEEDVELSAGLAIIQNGSILLCHPKGQKWVGTYSIPKGNVERGESFLEAAIRETKEEIGITIDPDDIVSKEPKFIDYKDKNGNIFKRVYYFIVKPKNKIKKEYIHPDKVEIDWAGFILKDAAKARIFWRLMPILDHIDEDQENDKEKEKEE